MKRNICLFGDSIAAGIGVPGASYSWCSILSDSYQDFNFINHGIGGQTSSDALKRIGKVICDCPAITTVQFGMNDHCIDESGRFAVSPDTFAQNMTSIIKTLLELNSEIILITNHIVIEGDEGRYYYHRHPYSKYVEHRGANAVIERYNRITRSLAARFDTALVDMHEICKKYDKYEFLRSLKNSESDDGVHPHILGAGIYAKEIGAAIDKIIGCKQEGKR